MFDTLDTAKRPFTDVDRKLAVQLSTYWVNYVKTGDPNGGDLARWPQFTSTERKLLELGESTQPRDALEGGKLVLFDRYVKSGGQLGIF